MTSAISAPTAVAPVIRTRSATAEESNATDIAAMQKVVMSLQKQVNEATPPDDSESQSEVKQIASQLATVQGQIASLRQKSAQRAQQVQQQARTEAAQQQPKPAHQVEKEEEQRAALATAKAAEAGLVIGTNVDTYA